MAFVKTALKPGLPVQLPPPPVAAALLAVYLIWGSTYLASAVALESYPPFMLIAMRLLVSIVILLPSVKWRKTARPSPRQALNAALTGALMFGGGAGLVALAQDLGVASGLTSLAAAGVTIWATLFAAFFGHRPGALELLGLVIGISGVAILNMENGMQAQPLGALVLVIGPMLWAFGAVMSSRLSIPSGRLGIAWQMAGGLAALALISWLRGETFPSDPSPMATAALLYLGVFGTLAAFSAYMFLVRQVRPALANSYAYVNPIIAVILGAWLLAEAVSAVGILAMTVIVAGVVLVMIGKKPPRRPTTGGDK